MRTLVALAFLPVLGWRLAPQDGAFESAPYGIRLKLPAGWTVGTSEPPKILTLNLPAKSGVTPEISIVNLAFTEEHITIGQFREQIRQHIQRQYVEPRILDERNVTVGGKPGFVFKTASKAKDTTAISFRGLVEISPSRLISFECVAPRDLEEQAEKSYDALLASVEFFVRPTPDGTAEGMKKFGDALAKVKATAEGFAAKQELEYSLEDRSVGLYAQDAKAATLDGAAGMEVTTVDVIDLGQAGRLEKRSKVFVADDLSKQRSDIEITHRGREGRVQFFTATVKLNGTEAEIDRRINGEKSNTKFSVPERTVVQEAVEPLQGRLLESGKGPVMSFPVLSAFDNQVSYLKLEHRGDADVKGRTGGIVKLTEMTLSREDGVVINYQYDTERKLVRRSVLGQGIILQTKK